jgi:hypothetical protein
MSNTLRASLSSDGVPFKSVDLSPYLDNTDSQEVGKTGSNDVNLQISGAGGAGTINTITNVLVPSNGTDGQVLTKGTGTNYGWQTANVNTDSTTILSQDSILIYYDLGVEYDRDTIRIPSSGGGGGISGSGTTNYISKWTGTTSQGNSQIFDNGNLVGIGIAIPTNFFHLHREDNSSLFRMSSGATGGFYVRSGAPNDGEFSAGYEFVSAVATARSTSASGMNFFNGGTYFVNNTGLTVNSSFTPIYSLVIHPNRRVGIGMGSTAPNAVTEIRGTGSTNSTLSLIAGNSIGVRVLEVQDGGDLLINNTITAGFGNSQITSNTAYGNLVLNANTTGSFNTGIGGSALRLNTTGTANAAIGGGAMYSNTTGEKNTAAGESALGLNTTGSFNTAVGWATFYNKATGDNNVAVGTEAGRYHGALTTMSIVDNSIFIGYRSRAAANNQTNQIVIGHDAIGLGSNTATIGNSSVTALYLAGAVGWFQGTGSPEGVVTAPVGSFYSNKSGGAGTTFYVKESGSGNVGWIGK